jgi:hypothetical protein
MREWLAEGDHLETVYEWAEQIREEELRAVEPER